MSPHPEQQSENKWYFSNIIVLIITITKKIMIEYEYPKSKIFSNYVLLVKIKWEENSIN